MEIQIDQNRLNLIDQEIFRLEREIAELELISGDCDAVRARLDARFDDVNSAYSYSQKMESLLESANKKKSALEKELRLNGKLRELREERSQIIARVKSCSATVGLKLVQPSQAENLYQAIEQTTTMYDAFISHATEDKESFVNEFVEELKSRTVKVWVDALRIQWGDSLRKSIDEGLQKRKEQSSNDFKLNSINKDYKNHLGPVNHGDNYKNNNNKDIDDEGGCYIF